MIGSQPATKISYSVTFIHLIDSLEATKLFTILLSFISMALTILSHEAVNNNPSSGYICTVATGSANLKT